MTKIRLPLTAEQREARIKLLRNFSAVEASKMNESISYNDVINSLNNWNIFDNWDDYELYNRPLDIAELAFCVADDLRFRSNNQ